MVSPAGTTVVSQRKGDDMPVLSIQFTEDELDTVRSAASGAGSSLRGFAKQAILDKALDRKGLVGELAQEIADSSAELNHRLT